MLAGEPSATDFDGGGHVGTLVILTVKVKSGREEEYAASMQGRLEEERRSPGVLQFDLFQSTDRPDTFVLFERFADEAAYALHRERMAARAPAAEDLRAGPPGREQFEV